MCDTKLWRNFDIFKQTTSYLLNPKQIHRTIYRAHGKECNSYIIQDDVLQEMGCNRCIKVQTTPLSNRVYVEHTFDYYTNSWRRLCMLSRNYLFAQILLLWHISLELPKLYMNFWYLQFHRLHRCAIWHWLVQFITDYYRLMCVFI